MKLYPLLFEATYDQDALKLSRDAINVILKLWREKTPVYKQEYHFSMKTKAFGDMTFVLKLDMNDEVNDLNFDRFFVGGSYTPNTKTLTLDADISTKTMHKLDLTDLVAKIKETINHEFEHAAQDKRGTLPNMDTYTTLDNGGIVSYYTQPVEVEAHMVGAKKYMDYMNNVHPDGKLRYQDNIYTFIDRKASELFKELVRQGVDRKQATNDIAAIHKVWVQYLTSRYPNLFVNTQKRMQTSQRDNVMVASK